MCIFLSLVVYSCYVHQRHLPQIRVSMLFPFRLDYCYSLCSVISWQNI